MSSNPPYTITPHILDRIEQIGEAVEHLEAAGISRDLHLQRINRIRAIHGSLAIAGNILSEEQVAMIFDGKSVVAPQVSPQVSPQVERLLSVLKGEMSRQEIQAALGLKDRKSFRRNYLLPALRSGYIEMTRPEAPNARNQRYRLTSVGLGVQ